MTNRLGGKVRIAIDNAKDCSEYYDLLCEITPSGTQGSVIDSCVEAFSPQKLAQAITDKNREVLLDTALSDNTVDRLFQIMPQSIMKLERTCCRDNACIELMLDGKFRPLRTLSDGERCTAVLSVILLDEHRPLIIDQPEDELDHDFIMQNVVRTLSEIKQKNSITDKHFQPRKGRQFIIATHNQNIPVLGDAELVMRMKKIPEQGKCVAFSAFGIDHVITIEQVLSLEGGPDAFRRRGQKYSTANI
jgi:hypothetical protein